MSIDEEKIYAALGKYVVCFQWLEQRLRQIAWHLKSPHDPSSARSNFVKMKYYDIIQQIKSLYEVFKPICKSDPDKTLLKDFGEVLKKCEEIGKQRNQIIHSFYLLIEADDKVFKIIQSRMRKDVSEPDGIDFDQLSVEENFFDSAMEDLAQAAVDLNFCYTQIIHLTP